jgi:hypothetical protein
MKAWDEDETTWIVLVFEKMNEDELQAQDV